MKLHPLSVPYRVLSRAIQFGWPLAIGLVLGSGDGFFGASMPFVVAAIGLLGVGVFVYEYVYYHHFEYELTADTLDIDSGVFARQAREVPFRRIQNVDVTRDVAQRALGIATVRIETAGGGSTEAVLECVSDAEASRLQTAIRQLKSEGVETESESTNLLYELDDRSLLAYSFLSFNPRLLSGVAVLVPFLSPFVARLGLGPSELGAMPILTVFLAGVGLLVLLSVIWLVSAAVRFVQFYGFRLVRDGDDLRYERGLLKRYTGTIPVEKIQSVSVTENVLMRQVGYATLAVETAGYAPGDAPSGGSEAAVPFATREAVVALAQRLKPFDPPAIERPPKRARRRYVGRYGILATLAVLGAFTVDVLLGVPLWWLTLVFLPVSVVAGHYRWAHLGHAEQASHAVTRSGFWSRSTTVVPYYRLQTVVESRTVFQRRWGLASLVYDTAGSRRLAGSDAVVHDVDTETATDLAAYAIERLRVTLGTE